MSDASELRLIDPKCYAEQGYPHEIWAELRRETPVHFFEPPGWPSFWAITKHADIVEISKQPDIFLNAPGNLTQPPPDISHKPGQKRRNRKSKQC